VETRIGATHILGIGDAAFQILGSAVALTMPVEDLGPLRYESHYGRSSEHYPADERRMILRGLMPVEDGELLIPDSPGLGIEVDRSRLARITADTVFLP
jgi:L-alanine-DL-glutamate epimerase-like enolase superfamily enzyme